MRPGADRVDDGRQGWEPCPPGEVRQLVQRIRGQRRRRAVLQVATGAVGLGLIAGVLLLGRTPGDALYGGISCSEVMAQADAFVAGALHGELLDRIEQHLTACSHCRAAIDQLRQDRLRRERGHAAVPPRSANLRPDRHPMLVAQH